MKIIARIESDHLPVEFIIKWSGELQQKQGEHGREENNSELVRLRWAVDKSIE